MNLFRGKVEIEKKQIKWNLKQSFTPKGKWGVYTLSKESNKLVMPICICITILVLIIITSYGYYMLEIGVYD